MIRLKVSKLIGTFMLVMSAMPAAQAYDFTVGGVYYNASADGKSAYVTYSDINNNAYSGDVNIPAQVSYRMNTMKVKGIGDHAFFNCQTVKSVTLHDGITYIGEQAFASCYAMTSITIPETLLRIDDFAFENCEDLTAIRIPKSVSQIGYCVFYNCRSISKYEVDPDNFQFAEYDGALYLKDKSILIQYPANKAETEFTIPDEVKQLTDYSFSPAPKLTKISIGANVVGIDALTFSECPALKAFEVSEDNSALCAVDGVLFDKAVSKMIQYPASREATEYSVPGTVTELGTMSMLDSKNITKLTLPASLTTIGDCALLGCQGIKEVISLSSVPPTTEKSYINPSGLIFENTVYANATLYVNEKDIETYRNDSEWGKFKSILDVNSAGITDVTGDATSVIAVNGKVVSATDGGEVKAYDLTGRLVKSGIGSIEVPASGIYLIKASGTVTKVTIR